MGNVAKKLNPEAERAKRKTNLCYKKLMITFNEEQKR